MIFRLQYMVVIILKPLNSLSGRGPLKLRPEMPSRWIDDSSLEDWNQFILFYSVKLFGTVIWRQLYSILYRWISIGQSLFERFTGHFFQINTLSNHRFSSISFFSISITFCSGHFLLCPSSYDHEMKHLKGFIKDGNAIYDNLYLNCNQPIMCQPNRRQKRLTKLVFIPFHYPLTKIQFDEI